MENNQLTGKDLRVEFYKRFKIAIQEDAHIRSGHCRGEYIHDTFDLFRKYRDEGNIKINEKYMTHTYYDADNNLYLIVTDEGRTRVITGASKITTIFVEEDEDKNRYNREYLNEIISGVDTWETLDDWQRFQIKEAFEILLLNYDNLEEKIFLYTNFKDEK